MTSRHKDDPMLRWAILGTGFISNTVVTAIGQSDGSRVELVAGRNAERVAASKRITRFGAR